jgi:hypothetical protein
MFADSSAIGGILVELSQEERRGRDARPGGMRDPFSPSTALQSVGSHSLTQILIPPPQSVTIPTVPLCCHYYYFFSTKNNPVLLSVEFS